MKIYVKILSWGLLLALSLTACDLPKGSRHSGPPPSVDGASALRKTSEFVALGARISGTPGAETAANWIARESRALGYNVTVDEWREPTDDGVKTFRNVIAVKAGHPERRVLLGGHYDTKKLPSIPDFAGANDSGSSTGLLLAIMHAVANRVIPRDTTLEFVFFDGEECVDTYGPRDGLHGSRHYAETIRREDLVRHYLAVIVLDMIGDRDLSVTIPMDTPCPLATALFQIAEEHRVREAFGYFPRGSILDDHRPFQELGIPSIDIIDFQFGPGNSYWHTGEDTMDKLSAASLEIVGNVALELVWRIAEKEGVLGID